MSLSADDVRKVAHLARLALDEARIEDHAERLGRILDFVGQLSAADTAGITPMAHPLDMAQRLRDDTVTEADRRDDFQAVAPETDEGLYLVPKVIE